MAIVPSVSSWIGRGVMSMIPLFRNTTLIKSTIMPFVVKSSFDNLPTPRDRTNDNVSLAILYAIFNYRPANIQYEFFKAEHQYIVFRIVYFFSANIR